MNTILLGTYEPVPTQFQLGIGIAAESDNFIAGLLCDEYQIGSADIEPYEVLILGYWTGDYCGEGWMLLRNRVTGELFENYASHCSCNGVEGQFRPTITSVAYLLSDNVSLSSDVDQKDRETIREFVRDLSMRTAAEATIRAIHANSIQ